MQLDPLLAKVGFGDEQVGLAARLDQFISPFQSPVYAIVRPSASMR
jgi:hypothetical protein